MGLFSSFIKSLRLLPNWQNQIPMSPKAQGDISGIVLPKITSNTKSRKIDIQYLEKIYECHDLVGSCIDLVSSTFALGKLRVKKYNNGKYEYVENHPLQLLLDNPNSSMTGYDLRQSYVVHRLLFGTIGMLLIRGHMVTNEDEANRCPECSELNHSEKCIHLLWHFNKGPITQVIPVHLDRLGEKTVETKFGKKTYFTYNWGNNIEMLIHPNNILTDPLYNPSVSFYGNSPTTKVQRWLEIDLGLTKQIGAYFANNAIPSMILNVKPPKEGRYDQNPAELMDMLKEKWMKRFSMNGDGNRPGSEVHSPAFTYGEMDVHKIQGSLDEIVAKPLFYEIQNRIAQTFKVPRSIFEFGLEYGSQSATAKQQREDFYNDAISPQMYSFKSKIERYIIPSFPDAKYLKIEWDLSDMGTASFIEEKRKDRTLREWELGLISRNETRSLLGYNQVTTEEGDDYYRLNVLGTDNGEGVISNNPDDNIFKSLKD